MYRRGHHRRCGPGARRGHTAVRRGVRPVDSWGFFCANSPSGTACSSARCPPAPDPLAGRTPLLPGIAEPSLLDIDSLLRPVYGHPKQGASFGHAKIAGRALLRKGLSPLVTTLSTPYAPPVIAEMRVRSGKTGSGRGAASQAGSAISTARACGATGRSCCAATAPSAAGDPRRAPCRRRRRYARRDGVPTAPPPPSARVRGSPLPAHRPLHSRPKPWLEEPEFHVYDNPNAFLTCNHDPAKALCHPERTRRNKPGATTAVDRCDPRLRQHRPHRNPHRPDPPRDHRAGRTGCQRAHPGPAEGAARTAHHGPAAKRQAGTNATKTTAIEEPRRSSPIGRTRRDHRRHGAILAGTRCGRPATSTSSAWPRRQG